MTEITDITWKIALRPWWGYIWRVFLISFAINFGAWIALAILNFEYVTAYSHLHKQPPVLSFVNSMVSLGISFAVAGIVFQRDYARFSVTAIDNSSGQQVELTPARTLRPWWSLMWRQALLTFAVVLPVIIVTTISLKLAHAGHPLWLGLCTLLIIAAPFVLIWVHIKIYGIVLRKRYNEFRMAVLGREAI